MKGDEEIMCRWGFDSVFLLHNDRSYDYMENDCVESSGYAVCNLGYLNPKTIPRDEITNQSRIHVSCIDRYGNYQSTGENLDIDFNLNFSQSL